MSTTIPNVGLVPETHAWIERAEKTLMKAYTAYWDRRPLPPNPWPPTSIMVDQTLHLLQLAILASVLL